MVAYKVKRLDGTWYTLGSGSLAKIRGVDGQWYVEGATGVEAKVLQESGTFGPGVPFGAGLSTEPSIQLLPCGDNWCLIYRPSAFSGASDGSLMSQWFFDPSPAVEDTGYDLCSGLVPSTLYHGNQLSSALKVSSNTSGVSGTFADKQVWLKWPGMLPPAGYSSVTYRTSAKIIDCGDFPTKSVQSWLLKGDDISLPDSRWTTLFNTYFASTDGFSLVTKDSAASGATIESWISGGHNYIGAPVSALVFGSTAFWLPRRAFASEVALVFTYASEPTLPPEAADYPMYA